MTLMTRKWMSPALALAAFFSLSCPALAQERYPDKTIRMIVPLAPGGATDTIARIVAKQISTELAVPVTIDNRTGAGGIIGMDAAVRAAPDGYTLFVGNLSTNALNQTVYADKLKFKPDDALMPVSMLATIPHLLVSSAKFEPTTVKELITYAKANPGKVNHASPGVGSYSMLDMLNFEKAAGLHMVHVPYAGGAGQYIAPMVSNEVQIAFLNASSVIEMVRAGKLRALAVTTDKRLPELPNVPTMAEAGFPGIGTNAWQGLFVPKGTPKPVVDRLYAAVAEALRQPEVLETFKKQLIIAAVSPSPEEYGKFVKTEVSRWATIVSSLNVKVE
ncbi:MAG: Tripartite-type tricarboxylate transporter, receptor component TctC [Betaproteobacteria bacterium]|nr:Tripartite-type tricarboxylate transporter, receptor component TctC [Betaproteobacteria bacterium]